MDGPAIILAFARGAHVLALVSLFGTLVASFTMVPSAIHEVGPAGLAVRDRLIGLARWSAVAAFPLGIVWVLFQAASITGATTLQGMVVAVWPVVLKTRFGHLMLVRLVLLLAAHGALSARSPRAVVLLPLTAAALALQGFIGHAGAMGGGTGAQLLASEALHLLAVGAWIGGLAPLFLLVGALPRRPAAAACQAFSLVGAISVAVIAGTALEQSARWIGGLGGLIGTRYGQTALLKLALFCVLLVLAALNRFVLTARLLDADAPRARDWLRLSVAVEAVLGTLAVIVAAFLASGIPATHEQPDWPFSWRPSLELLGDPEAWSLFRGPASLAAGAVVLTGIGWFWRAIFWPSLGGALVLLALAASRAAPLLTVEAWPTSFVTSPTEFAVGSIARGGELFSAHCVGCHGVDGRGDGPAASTLPIRPADLTAPHFLGHTEGDLFWFIAHGMNAPSGRPAMPGFSGTLSSDGLWALIDYLRAHHAGATMRPDGSWNEPVTVPRFDAVCADGTNIAWEDLRGQPLRIVAVTREAAPPTTPTSVEGIDVRTILLARHPSMRPLNGTCATIEPEAWSAFAILLGTTPDDLAGTQMLADANLWLRARRRPGGADNWNDPRGLAAILRDIAAHPLPPAAGGGHGHH